MSGNATLMTSGFLPYFLNKLKVLSRWYVSMFIKIYDIYINIYTLHICTHIMIGIYSILMKYFNILCMSRF